MVGLRNALSHPTEDKISTEHPGGTLECRQGWSEALRAEPLEGEPNHTRGSEPRRGDGLQAESLRQASPGQGPQARRPGWAIATTLQAEGLQHHTLAAQRRRNYPFLRANW